MRIETVEIPGPAGRLEGLLNFPDGDSLPARAAIVCHPHPLFGGTLHNKVVFHTARALNHTGWPVLRFNYRGVGASQGALPPQEGRELLEAARQDLKAALDWLLERWGDVSVCGAGFSFGSRTMLEFAGEDPRIERILAIGTPSTMGHMDRLLAIVSRLPQPKLFVQGDQDEFGPPAGIGKIFEAASDPKRLISIPGASHFFPGRLNELRAAVAQIAEPIGELPAA